jgi:hypothetical protein
MLTNADDSGTFLGRVVEDTLAYFIVQMRAVVVCFHCTALRIVSVGVEGVQMSAYPLDWSEVLIRSVSCCVKDLIDIPESFPHQSRACCCTCFPAHRPSCCLLGASPCCVAVSGNVSFGSWYRY